MLSYYVCTYLTLLEFKFHGLLAFCLFCLLLGLQCLAQCLEHKHSFINSHGMSKLWKSSLEWVHGGEQYKGIVKECSVVLSRQCRQERTLGTVGSHALMTQIIPSSHGGGRKQTMGQCGKPEIPIEKHGQSQCASDVLKTSGVIPTKKLRFSSLSFKRKSKFIIIRIHPGVKNKASINSKVIPFKIPGSETYSSLKLDVDQGK